MIFIGSVLHGGTGPGMDQKNTSSPLSSKKCRNIYSQIRTDVLLVPFTSPLQTQTEPEPEPELTSTIQTGSREFSRDSSRFSTVLIRSIRTSRIKKDLMNPGWFWSGNIWTLWSPRVKLNTESGSSVFATVVLIQLKPARSNQASAWNQNLKLGQDFPDSHFDYFWLRKLLWSRSSGPVLLRPTWSQLQNRFFLMGPSEPVLLGSIRTRMEGKCANKRKPQKVQLKLRVGSVPLQNPPS